MIFWHTSTSLYSEHIYLFHVPHIHHTKWCQLAKVNNDDFALTNALTNAKGVQHNLFRRTCLDELPSPLTDKIGIGYMSEVPKASESGLLLRRTHSLGEWPRPLASIKFAYSRCDVQG